MCPAGNLIDEDISRLGDNDLVYDMVQASISRATDFA